MQGTDIDACAGHIQKSCYPDLIVSRHSYWHRFAGYPAGNFVIEVPPPSGISTGATAASAAVVSHTDVLSHHGVVAYAQSFPWRGSTPPRCAVTDGELDTIPHDGDFLWVFDIATSVRKRGFGEALLQAVLDHGRARGFKEAHLVAVGGAEGYWSRFGFREVRRLPPGSGYGDHESVYMALQLKPDGTGDRLAGAGGTGTGGEAEG